MRTRRGPALAAAMLAMGVALAACGADDDGAATTAAGASSSAATSRESAAPEDRIAPDAEVGAGLAALKGVAAKVSGETNGAGAKTAAEGLEPVWQPVEGTVKKNEPELYLDIEDSFQRMESGDLDNARKGAAALGDAVDAYLAKHPG